MLVSYTNNMFEESFALLEALTPKRVQLMRKIHSSKPCSIRDLAEILERDIKNVWEDLRRLSNMDLVDFECKGRVKKPVIKKQIIITTVVVKRNE
jgi:predicted transcriptional regulator